MYDPLQNDMAHLLRVKLKSQRYFSLQCATKYDSAKIFLLLLFLCATMYDPLQNDMDHLPRVEPKAERSFRSQFTTKYDSVKIGFQLLVGICFHLFFLIGFQLLGQNDMEHLSRVKPKSERYCRSQSTTKYVYVEIGLLLLVLICLLFLAQIDLLGFSQICFQYFGQIDLLGFSQICFQYFGQNDMVHLLRVKLKSQRYFRAQSATDNDSVKNGLILIQIGLLVLVQLEKTLKKLEKLIWQGLIQFEEDQKQFEESILQCLLQLEENQKQFEESILQREKTLKKFEESTWQEGTRRLVQRHQELIAPKYKPRHHLTTYWILYQALIIMHLVGLCCGLTRNTDCLTTQSVLLGSQGNIRCRLFENSKRFFWYDTNNVGGDTLLIKLENGRVSGIGYTTGEFNIASDGSLIINSVTVQHERVFHLESLSPSLVRSTKDITVIVYVEPIEPVPVITECLGKSDCIMKGNLDGVVSCVHHNTRPAATISWFMREGTHDIPLNATTNQTLSADLITFSVTSEMAISEILPLANMQSLVLLVCKSHNPYSVVQESDSKVLLDLSQNDPFEKQSDLPEDPVYAIQNIDLVIERPLPISAEDSIVMWMAKSLEKRNSVYLKYSAYGVVPSMETDEQVSLDKSSDLVISQVGLQHEGQYACVHSTGNNTKSYLQRVEVIVQPTPPKVLVEGCKLFQPCSFHITETKTITCKVNGVHPKVELMIKSLSTNLAVIKTEVSTYEDEGLFYTSIRGDVILVDASCHENGTIICQAVGPAANVFKSDVHITILSHGEKCPQTSAAPFPADKAVQTSSAYITFLTIAVAFLFLCFAIILVIIASIIVIKYCAKRNRHCHMQSVPVTDMSNV